MSLFSISSLTNLFINTIRLPLHPRLGGRCPRGCHVLSASTRIVSCLACEYVNTIQMTIGCRFWRCSGQTSA